jgi:hypothetical protein
MTLARMRYLLPFICALIVCAGRDATARGVDEATVVVRWNQALLQAVRDGRMPPPQVARALAIVHTCMFDAWAAYDDDAVGTRLGGTAAAVLRADRGEQNRSGQRSPRGAQHDSDGAFDRVVKRAVVRRGQVVLHIARGVGAEDVVQAKPGAKATVLESPEP